MAEEEKPISDALNDVAKEIAKQIPDSLLIRLIGEKLGETLKNLASTYGRSNIQKIVEEAIDKAVARILESPEFASRVEAIAKPLANEALIIAKQEVQVKRKEKKQRY